MLSNHEFPSLEQLPESYAIQLNHLSAISVSGEEADKYLQGQLTCDVNLLESKHLLTGSHCDAKGKVFSAFRLIKKNDRRLLIQNDGSLISSMAELKKFGVFAKVTIEQATDLSLLAVVGFKAEQLIKSKFGSLPDSFAPVIHADDITVVYISGVVNRYLLIANVDTINNITNTIELPLFQECVWTLLEVVSGFPHMSHSAVNEYVPQSLNLQHLHGISFTKGCYLGQETVARMKYLGKNKRALYALHGNGNINISDDSVLEVQLGENWRRAGSIIAHYSAGDNQIYLQAILASDLQDNAKLRIKEQPTAAFTLMDLPYSKSVD